MGGTPPPGPIRPIFNRLLFWPKGHVLAKFHQDRTIFTRVMVDIYTNDNDDNDDNDNDDTVPRRTFFRISKKFFVFCTNHDFLRTFRFFFHQEQSQYFYSTTTLYVKVKEKKIHSRNIINAQRAK